MVGPEEVLLEVEGPPGGGGGGGLECDAMVVTNETKRLLFDILLFSRCSSQWFCEVFRGLVLRRRKRLKPLYFLSF